MSLSMNTIATTRTDASPPVVDFACKVQHVKNISANTYEVELTVPDDVELNYIAGHYLKLELNVENDSKFHSLFYSIANNLDPENPHRIQIFIQKMSDFSDKIIKRLVEYAADNNSINVTLPMGQSFLQTDLTLPHLLIASGSGIAKIRCLTKEILQQKPDAHVQLYWSNRNIDDFYLLDELQNLVDHHENLTFTPILEASDKDWLGRSGFIYEVIQEDYEDFDNTRAYLCGSPNMVYGTIDQLKTKGLEEAHCYSDAFEFAPRETQTKLS